MPAVIVVLCVLFGLSAIIGIAQGVAGVYEDANSPGMSAFLGICQTGLFIWLCAAATAPLPVVLWVVLVLFGWGILINLTRAATGTWGRRQAPGENFLGGLLAAGLMVWLLVVFA